MYGLPDAPNPYEVPHDIKLKPAGMISCEHAEENDVDHVYSEVGSPHEDKEIPLSGCTAYGASLTRKNM